MLHVIVGYDPREADAAQVCKHSLIRRSSEPIQVHFLNRASLEASGLYWRKYSMVDGQRIDAVDKTPFSTEFSFTRFLVPEIARRNNIHDPIMFVDCDFLFLDDVAKLFDSFEVQEGKAVGVVKHNYVPAAQRKMDNCIQVPYNRKLWSALMLFNPWHPACLRLTPEVVSTATGAYLHQLQWVDDPEVADLPENFHWIPGASPTTGQPTTFPPSAIHYTEGGPWFENYRDVPFATEWNNELAHLDATKFNWNKTLIV